MYENQAFEYFLLCHRFTARETTCSGLVNIEYSTNIAA